jgi:RNA polymerase sigma-70 factor (ECF subfamily)
MRRHNQRLYRVARSVVRDESEAEDIVQEAYVRAYSHLSRLEGRSSVATWLTRIAFHEALRRRRRGRRVRASAAVSGEPVAPPDPGTGVHAESGGSLRAALDALPEGVRTVVVLRLVQGLSTRETARSLRLSESNVKVMLHRGKRLLASSLDAGAPDLREQYIFGAERCDRVVAAVFRRIGASPLE